jgi:hypothetical protein
LREVASRRKEKGVWIPKLARLQRTRLPGAEELKLVGLPPSSNPFDKPFGPDLTAEGLRTGSPSRERRVLGKKERG